MLRQLPTSRSRRSSADVDPSTDAPQKGLKRPWAPDEAKIPAKQEKDEMMMSRLRSS
jgi:hypothetical protein